MPRILHLGKYFPPFAGGMENFLADLLVAQIQQGQTVAALVHDHQSQWSRLGASVQPETLSSQSHSVPIYRVPSYGRLLYAPVSPHFPFWLRRVLQDFQPDILHLHLPNTSAFWALLSPHARRLPWVIHWHADVISEVNSSLSMAYHAYRPFEQNMLAHAQAIIATSAPYLASSLALQPWREKCHVIPLGLSFDRLPEQAPYQTTQWAMQQWNPSRTKFLCVGRLTYYKGHETLLNAFAQIEDAQLLMIGQGELRSQLESLITALNLKNRVKLLGYCHDEQLTALFSTCDCFCLPSVERTEAFGLVLLEAMRYAKPILATAIPGSGVTWVVQDKQTGLLVPPANVPAMIQAVQQMADAPSYCIQLGQAGFRRFMQLFDIKQVSLEVTKLYNQL